jgi:UDP-3-O-[3-hydroxymyristoyl] glucosamine N-acyltransferase
MHGIDDIRSLLARYEASITQGSENDIRFNGAAYFANANETDVVWIGAAKNASTHANLVIAGPAVSVEELKPNQVVIQCSNSKGLFAEMVNELLVPATAGGIHESAVIHPEAQIHPSASIGPNCSIGKCEIGEGTVLDGNVFIHDGMVINRFVRIGANVTIGAQGSGLTKNADSNWIPFPQLGKVILKDHVSVGANSYIARGALEDTIIGEYTHIGLSCAIAHNTQIGSNTLILANSVVCGSCRIGDDVWIAPGSSIINKCQIGDGAVVGLGSNVVKDVPAGVTVIGNPARAKVTP